MHWGFFVRRDVAYIPTCARTEAGFYFDIEPIEIARISNTDEFRKAIKAALSRGNPTVPTPRREDYGKTPILKYAKVKSWPQMERESSFWGITENNGSYEFGPYRRRSDKGWEEDTSRIVKIPSFAAMDGIVEQIVSEVQRSDRSFSQQ